MREFMIGDYVKWKDHGNVLVGKIETVNKTTANIVVDYEWVEKIPLSKLTYLPPIKLNENEYQAIVRLDKNILEVLGDNVVENLINEEDYKITVEDFVFALKKNVDLSIDEIAYNTWCDFLGQQLFIQAQKNSLEVYTEDDALLSMHTYIYHPWSGFNSEGILEAVREGTIFIEDRNENYLERRYPIYIKERLLEKLENDAVMNEASEEHVILYRKFAEELASIDNIYGLNAVGYGCYGGNRAFDCDWERSRDSISKLFEIENEMPKKAFLANTLGYIYYYGRCNNGVPQYEEAYKCFSFAAFNEVYEAQYKIADMFKNGYGVVKSPETARNIVATLYNENIKYIREGNFNCKFADIALRMGGMCTDREDGENDYEEALYYYTQAEYAIRMRMMETNYYGDSKVSDAIANALASAKEKLAFKLRRSVRYYSLIGLLGAETADGRRLDLVIKKNSDLTYKMTFAAHKRLGEKRRRKMFLTVPAIGMCGLFSKLTLTYKAAKALDEGLLDRVLVVDEMSYHEFFCDGARLFFTVGYFLLKSNKKSDVKRYRFASVSFGGAKLYDYLCDDEGICVGDRVTVNAGGEEKEVVVCRIFEKNESETSLPLKEYKRVIKKEQ